MCHVLPLPVRTPARGNLHTRLEALAAAGATGIEQVCVGPKLPAAYMVLQRVSQRA